MHNYDFEILQYNEFENLTRDLLQVEFGIYIESFKDGKDGGIDLRFGNVKGQKCIVQVKKYKTYSSLKSILSKEAKKVPNLQPNRYILSTSAPLSPANKEEIKEIFKPYIQNAEDIFGKDDINNLLGKHPEIESQYYKLWLGSTEVLNEIVHKSIRNWSKFELATIQEEVKTYVSNESFNQALNILKEHHYVIISGIPGIGKTTLARMLVYYLLANQYDEFVCIEDNLHDAASIFQEGKKQVFFFDDFLGSNVFDPIEKDFENKLVSFISAIKREKGKMFIMTTREYILSQAKEYYEKFQIKNLETAKCIVDMESYTEYIKAQILYNHIAEAHLPDAYIEQLLRGNNYQKIISHKYFNPRIIETYIDNELWKNDSPEKFVPAFLHFFDKPTNVWKVAFEKLSLIAQYSLLVLGTMGKEVMAEDWHEAFRTFCQVNRDELHLECSDAEWEKQLRILEDCFVAYSKTKQQKLLVRLYNPSVLGFIVEYVGKYKDLQRQLLEGSKYVEQLYSIFTSKKWFVSHGDAYVFLEEEELEVAQTRLVEMINDSRPSCSLLSSNPDLYQRPGKIEVLFEYSSRHFVANGLRESLISIEDFADSRTELSSKVRIAEWVNWSEMSFSKEEAARLIVQDVVSINDVWDIVQYLDEIQMNEILDDEDFLSDVNAIIESEIESGFTSIDETQALRDIVESISERLSVSVIPVGDYLQRIEEAEEKLYADMPDYDEDYYREVAYRDSEPDQSIAEMMTSLRILDQEEHEDE